MLAGSTGSHRFGGHTTGDAPSSWTSGTSTVSPSSTMRPSSGTSSGPPEMFFTRDIGFLSPSDAALECQAERLPDDRPGLRAVLRQRHRRDPRVGEQGVPAELG